MQFFGQCLLVIMLLAEFAYRPAAPDPGRKPSPELSPLDVVTIQVNALQHFDEPAINSGAWTTFQFASPANRRVTGPYGHFLQLLKGPQNRRFLHARSARFFDERRTGSYAEVSVELEEQDHLRSVFTFALSKQTAGACAGCWMTDGVQQVFQNAR